MAADVKVQFEEAHFTSLPSQTNIYGLTSVFDEAETAKVLISSLKGKVFLVEYGNKWDNPTSRELPFTYIPSGDADIISIDCFMQQVTQGRTRLVIGISFMLFNIHSSPSSQKQFFNIYSCVEEGKEHCLDSIAEGCQHIELNFVPFHLYHTKIKTMLSSENVFLLTGSDHKVHMYQEVVDKNHQLFKEQKTELLFPELQDLPSSVMWIDIQEKSPNQRLTAVGCQNGFVQMAVVDIEEEPTIVSTWSVQHDGTITSVRVFTVPTAKAQTESNKSSDASFEEQYHLLICCSIEPSVLYLDVINQGFDRLVVLPESDKYDCVLCTCIADVDWDGHNEIILGTYGQELLVYKLTNPSESESSLDMNITWQKSFSSPLFAIEYLDLTGDGVREVIVACLSGLHILQHQLDDVAKVYAERM